MKITTNRYEIDRYTAIGSLLNILKSDLHYTPPEFLKNYLFKPHYQADADALFNDWLIVGNHLRESINKFAKEYARK